MVNCFYITLAVLFVGAHAGVINWDKYDPILLGNQTDLQQDYPKEVIANHTVEGSGIEPTEQKDKPITEKVDKCQNGWMRFENSCYFVERTNAATVEEAKKECEKKVAKLFTPNTEDEYKTMMGNTAVYAHTWTGLSKKTDAAEPVWQSETQFDYKKMDWLVKPYSAASNGFSTISHCAAYYNGPTKFNYFYPCDWKFLYICKKSAFVPLI